jgi:hypothetical protein
MIDAELKALLEGLATKADLSALATKEDIALLRRDLWELAGDVAKIDGKVDRLADAVRKSGVAI